MEQSEPNLRHPTIGWREWVALPNLKVPRIKAKVDTGARSSSLHAFDIELLLRRSHTTVRFKVHPVQGDNETEIACQAPLHEQRWVKSSNGKRELRPVIRTLLHVDGEVWPIDVTLTSRDEMGFRMLLGREAVRHRFVVDPGASFMVKSLRPKKKKKTKTKTKSKPARTSKKKSKKKSTTVSKSKKKPTMRKTKKKMQNRMMTQAKSLSSLPARGK